MEGLNLIEILKNARKGLELYSIVHGDVKFDRVDELNKDVFVCDKKYVKHKFTVHGTIFYTGKECLLFPSSEYRTWDGWQDVLFKKDDFIFCNNGVTYYIDGENKAISDDGIPLNVIKGFGGIAARYATLKEGELFVRRLTRNGYEIQNGKIVKQALPLEKFAPEKLQPFDKVLVRDGHNGVWQCDIFSSINDDSDTYVCVGGVFHYCIPYNEDTKHLRGSNLRPPVSYDIF